MLVFVIQKEHVEEVTQLLFDNGINRARVFFSRLEQKAREELIQEFDSGHKISFIYVLNHIC